MKYQISTIIDLPLEETINKMDNPENMQHWQRGLVGYKQLSGTPGTQGAQMQLDYDFGKRKMSLTETIVKNEFPQAFHATYEAKGVYNLQENHFEALSDGRTQWTSKAEFRFDSFGMKVMAFLMPGAFKKQSKKYMDDFKAFAEHGTSVKDA